MTPRYPGAVWHPAGADQGGNNGPTSFSWHGAITTGNGVAIGGWVAQSNACHGFVEEHGGAYQYKDYDRVAYGALAGNQRGVVTIETWDGLRPATATYNDVNEGAWTPQQCERIADWMAWALVELGIPLQRLRGTRDRGHGPHGTGIPNRTSNRGITVYEGPDRWSTDTQKPCPGDLRIRQLYGPGLDGGDGSILQRGRVIADAARSGRCGWLPPGDVDLDAALRRTGGTADWLTSASLDEVKAALREAIG